MLSIIVNGSTTYSLDDGSLCLLRGYQGWGSLPLTRITDRGGQQDGDSDLGWAGDPRVASLTLKFPLTDLDDYYTSRDTLNRIFAPDNELILTWALPYGNRYIDVKASGGIDLPWAARQWAQGDFLVVLRASNPAFYDPDQQAITFTVTGGGTGWAIPWAIPWGPGGSAIDETEYITYTGSYKSYPILRLQGPLTDPVITHAVLGDTLDLTGSSIGGGAYYEIDCRYGYKRILDNAGNDVTYKLSDDSDIDTFRLDVDPIVPGGINPINVQASGANSSSAIYLRYYRYYTGV